MTVVNRDPSCSKWLRASSRVRVLKRPSLKRAREAQNLFVLASASGLGEVAAFVREANRRNQLRALLIHADMEERWIGQMLHRADLRTLRHTHVHREHHLPRRVLKAWEFGSQDILIADALALADRLIVLTCDLKRIEVPWDSIPVLSRIEREKRAEFEIDSDGSCLHWPEGDIHLGYGAFREAVDPVFREHVLRRERLAVEKHGRAIARLRKRHGVRQDAIQGLSGRQVRRIERGEAYPRVSTLEKLARAHRLSLDEYLDGLARLIQIEG